MGPSRCTDRKGRALVATKKQAGKVGALTRKGVGPKIAKKIAGVKSSKGGKKKR